MATIIVRSDHDHAILMQETVLPAHLDDDHKAVQLLEHLAWAIGDAHGQRQRMHEIVRRQGPAAQRQPREAYPDEVNDDRHRRTLTPA
jgi:hypothetical protein